MDSVNVKNDAQEQTIAPVTYESNPQYRPYHSCVISAKAEEEADLVDYESNPQYRPYYSCTIA